MRTYHPNPSPHQFEAWWHEHYGALDARDQQGAEWKRTPKAPYQKLWKLGADLDYVDTMVKVLQSDVPVQATRGLLQKISREDLLHGAGLLDEIRLTMHDLHTMLERPRALSLLHQYHIARELDRLQLKAERVSEPFTEAWQRLDPVRRPLYTFLEREQCRGMPGVRPSKGQPSREIPTLFMVLLTDHLRQSAGSPHYRNAGHMAKQLFSKSFAEKKEQKEDLAVRVEDRCRDFRARHDIEALRTAVLSFIPSHRHPQ
jgi:hypothetical protein